MRGQDTPFARMNVVKFQRSRSQPASRASSARQACTRRAGGAGGHPWSRAATLNTSEKLYYTEIPLIQETPCARLEMRRRTLPMYKIELESWVCQSNSNSFRESIFDIAPNSPEATAAELCELINAKHLYVGSWTALSLAPFFEL